MIMTEAELHKTQMKIIHSMLEEIAQDIKDGKSITDKFIALFETYHVAELTGNKLAKEEGTKLAEFFIEQRRENTKDILTEAEKTHVGLV